MPCSNGISMEHAGVEGTKQGRQCQKGVVCGCGLGGGCYHRNGIVTTLKREMAMKV